MRAVSAFALLMLSIQPVHSAGSTDWIVDPRESRVSFRYSEDGALKVGRFDRFAAAITFDPLQPENTTAVFRVFTDSLDLGDPFKETLLAGEGWFDSVSHPVATLTVDHLVPNPDDGSRFHAVGTLTIKQIEKRVRVETTLRLAGRDARATGELTLARSDFAMHDGVVESFVTVGDTVAIEFDLVAHRPD